MKRAWLSCSIADWHRLIGAQKTKIEKSEGWKKKLNTWGKLHLEKDRFASNRIRKMKSKCKRYQGTE